MISRPSLSRRILTTVLASTLLQATNAVSITRPVTLDLKNAQIAPDGFQRSASLANGVYPAPLISGNMNDSFRINVKNDLTDTTMDLVTSIHWHGLFQQGTNWADGPAFVTQCPIIPKQSFEYDFSVPGQAGTYWYHSHYQLQYCDGLRGPLVIYDPNDPLKDMYDVDDASTVLTLSDWYHEPASQVPAPPNSNPVTLINSLGRNPTNLTAPLTVVNVQKGKRYRFRVVSMSCEPSWNFTIDGHKFTVIEADGVETQPLEVDSFTIYAAQRYSIVLTADQPVDNYWIRALPDLGNTTFIGGQNSAILRYKGAPNAEPKTTQTPSVNPLYETNLHPLVPVPVPGGNAPGDVDTPITLTLGFNFTTGHFTFNNVSFAPPEVPVLLQILSGNGDPFDLAPAGSIYPIPNNNGTSKYPKTIEITMNGGVIGGPHPIHLHGHNFHVIRSAGSDSYNYENPVIRDTVNTGSNTNDVTVIRFTADNPGPWFIHCHIDFHLNLGFAAVMAEEVPQVKSAVPVPAEWSNLCPLFDKYNAGMPSR